MQMDPQTLSRRDELSRSLGLSEMSKSNIFLKRKKSFSELNIIKS